MSGEKIVRALDAVQDAQLQSAMGVYERKRKMKYIWVRSAIFITVLVLLVTALLWSTEENYIIGPGVLVVHAYGTDEPTLSEENSVVLEEGIVVPMEYTYDPAISALSKALGLPFRFSVLGEEYTDQEISFEIYLSGGDFEHLGYLSEFSDYFLGLDDSVDSYDVAKARYLGDHFTIPNNKTIYWRATGHLFDDEKREIQYIELDTDRVFVDVVVRADDHIVGFAVIEICDMGVENRCIYNTKLMKSVSFPQVDGRFQKISEKYVKEQIRLIHDNA